MQTHPFNFNTPSGHAAQNSEHRSPKSRQRNVFRLVSTCLTVVLALTGAFVPGFLSPASAQDNFAYQEIMSFDGGSLNTTGSYPSAGVVQGVDGALYGTAGFGGPNYSEGTVFKLNPDGTGFTVLHAFMYPDGLFPWGGLTRGAAGELYGITAGSAGIACTVFKLNSDGTGFQILLNLEESLGAEPRAGLIQGTDGALYGTSYGTSFGEYPHDGMVFKLNTDGTGFTVLHNFDDSTGKNPTAALMQGTDGALYGTTTEGGSSGFGTIFKLNTNGTGFTVLLNLYESTVAYASALAQGADGALYGTAEGGGNSGVGAVFKLNTNGTGFTVLQHLDVLATGYSPYGGLIQAVDGALYGTTSGGGSGGYGTLFRLNPDGTGYTVMHNFTTAGPIEARLMQGTDGAFYGTTRYGGDFGGGSVFRLLEINVPGTLTLTPASRPLGGGGFTLTLDGASFEEGSVAQWDGVDMETTFVSSTRLTAIVPTPPPSSSLEPAQITVRNPAGFITVGAILLPAQIPADSVLLQTLKAFGQLSPAGLPRGELLEGADGALYGTAQFGGLGHGTVFKLNTDGSGLTAVHSFDRVTTGASPWSGLIQDADGTLYGTALEGGANEAGTIFKLNPDGSGFTVLHSFDVLGGANPFGMLLQAADGMLYGTAANGGLGGGGGTVFRLNTDGTGFAVLKIFDFDSTGRYLQAGLIQGTDGALYGTAQSGGTSGGGTVFKLNTDGSGFEVLKHFGGVNGSDLVASVIQATDGALYGSTTGGGNHGHGTLFKLNSDGSGFTVLKHFNDFYEGRFPRARVIQGVDGALYGATNEGGSAFLSGGTSGGTVFKINLDGSGFTVLQSLDTPLTGGAPQSGLIQASDGTLYGTTSGGGIHEFGGTPAGTVFKVNPNGSGFSVINHLTGDIDLREGGGFTESAVLRASDGRLYGTNPQGGSRNVGTIFGLNADGSGFSVLHNFDAATTGATPYSALIQGTDGALYGTTASGGPENAGVLFRLNVDGSAFSVLRAFGFSNDDGFQPLGPLMQASDGALYGTATYGGMYGAGIVFKISTDGSGFTVLKHLEPTTTGNYPTAGLIQATDGKLYGAAYRGGSNDGGTVFTLNTDGSGFAVILNLDETTGISPYASLIQGTSGALYGVTQGGGSLGTGTIFRLNPDGTGAQVLHHFENSTTGVAPWTALVQGPDGMLYGAAGNGGLDDQATVFRLNQDGTGFSLLYSGSGLRPSAVTFGPDGALYGTAYQGGPGRAGMVFRLVAGTPRPDIIALTPPAVATGTGPFTLTVTGTRLAEGAVVQWNGEALDTNFVSDSELIASVTSVPVTSDIFTALITVRNPDSSTSDPAVFVVTAPNVALADSDVAQGSESVSVTTAPVGTGNSTGLSATLTNSGDPDPVAVTAAIYSGNPSPSTAFEFDTAIGVAGGFMDLQVTGADAADTVNVWFYYPEGTEESGGSPVLKYYDGSDWVPVLSSGGIGPEKDTTNDLDGTVSAGRLSVTFDDTSTPAITDLGGTYFAITYPRPPLTFTGFLAPIGGADASGGSFGSPLKTFKGGSTIPVKFKIDRDGTLVVTGAHRLQAVQYSNETTAGTPIDATPQDAATAGNQFVLNGSQWHFNLDTKATGLTKGVWELVVTLSDGSKHRVWIQVK